MQNKIGFMQGRLSPLVDGKIQCFPWDNWEDEFKLAQEISLSLMEWTLDQDDLYKNPLMTSNGRLKIRQLMSKYKIQIPSLTGDCFMQAPFFKLDSNLDLLNDFKNIALACSDLGMKTLVYPLVDNSSITSSSEEYVLIKQMLEWHDFLQARKLQIAFESDFNPKRLRQFINKLPSDTYGINYDIGNSASLGYNPIDEFNSYGDRILNVHIKDRVLGGKTVPLGEGNADFKLVFNRLKELNYNGNFILQTARAKDNRHQDTLRHFYHFSIEQMS